MLRKYIKHIFLIIYKLLQRIKIYKKPKHIFVFAHMRSGSSLLTHIIASKDDVIGFGELHRKYISHEDFLKNEIYIRRIVKNYLPNISYTVNQITSNDLTPNHDIFNRKDLYLIFLTREPIESISSYVNLINEHGFDITMAQVIEYFEARLKYMSDLIISEIQCKKIWVTYEDLINETDATLKALSEFLGLCDPLKKEYKTHSLTGTHGDPSENIKVGRIIRTNYKICEEIDAEQKNILLKSYESACNNLKNYHYKRYIH